MIIATSLSQCAKQLKQATMPMPKDVAHRWQQDIAKQRYTRLKLERVYQRAARIGGNNGAVMSPCTVNKRLGIFTEAPFPHLIELKLMTVEWEYAK